MPTFIHNGNQQRAINLDYLDSIKKDNQNGFEIVFERVVSNRVPNAIASGFPDETPGGMAEVGRWRFENEKERDKVLKSILDSFGMRIG